MGFSLSLVIPFSNQIPMESALISTTTATAETTRLIEYPDDLSGCNAIDFDGRQLLYLCSLRVTGKTPFVVVLGFYSGQIEDIVTKDLIEPVAEEVKQLAYRAVANSLPEEYVGAHILFL